LGKAFEKPRNSQWLHFVTAVGVTVELWSKLNVTCIVLDDQVRTAQETLSLLVKKQTYQLMLYREVIAICSEIHTKHTNTLCGHNVQLSTVKPSGNKIRCTKLLRWVAS
jgi:Arc/MetJ family transcription regulator